MFVEVNDIKIWCDIEGEGFPMILPSYSGNLYFQRTLPLSLRKLFKLIFIEPRGGGKSDGGEKISLDLMTDDIEEIRKIFGLEKVLLFGWAANAYINLEYTLKYPNNVLGNIIVSMPVKYDEDLTEIQKLYWNDFASQKRKKILDSNIRNFEKYKSENSNAPLEELLIEEYIANAPKYFYDPLFNPKKIWRRQKLNVKGMFNFHNKILKNYNALEKLNQIKSPIINFNGKYDFIAPPKFAVDVMESFSNVTSFYLQKSGHYPFMEEERLFVKYLLKATDKILPKRN